jgi:hypothetical protein
MRPLSDVIAAGLLAGAALASAQYPDLDSVIQAAAHVTALVDAGRYAEVWEDGSPLLKRTFQKPQFVATVARARQATGIAATRAWRTVMRRDAGTSPDRPAGLYVDVQYTTTFKSGQVAREQVSLRLEGDHEWRVTNYLFD